MITLPLFYELLIWYHVVFFSLCVCHSYLLVVSLISVSSVNHNPMYLYPLLSSCLCLVLLFHAGVSCVYQMLFHGSSESSLLNLDSGCLALQHLTFKKKKNVLIFAPQKSASNELLFLITSPASTTYSTPMSDWKVKVQVYFLVFLVHAMHSCDRRFSMV